MSPGQIPLAVCAVILMLMTVVFSALGEMVDAFLSFVFLLLACALLLKRA